MKSSNSFLSQNTTKQDKRNSVLLSKNYIPYIGSYKEYQTKKVIWKSYFITMMKIPRNKIYKNLSPVKFTFFELCFFGLAGQYSPVGHASPYNKF